MEFQDQSEAIRQERLNDKNPDHNFWRHIFAAKDALPKPLNEQGRLAKLAIFNDGIRRNSGGNALDALECLADVNDCSPEFWKHLNAASDAIETSSTLRRLSISPFIDDHPKNRNITHIAALPLLSPKDQQIIEECLHAAVEGPFFPEREFFALFGSNRSDIAALLSTWSDVNDADKNPAVAINNTLLHLLGYARRDWNKWPGFISVSPREVALVFQRWRRAKGWKYKSAEDSYFDQFEG